MNIIEALETLHNNKVVAYLDKDYVRLNVDPNATKSNFKRNSSYVEVPAPEITSNGGLTLTYAITGKNGENEETHYQKISIIKNCEFHHTKLIISDDFVGKVKELGMNLNGNVLDLTQFPIEKKEVDLKVLFTNACNTYAAKLTKRIERKSSGKKENSAKPIAIKVEKPHYPSVKVTINKCSGKPKIEDVNTKIAQGKKLNFAENLLNEIDKHNMKFYDMTKQVNLDKFNLLMNRKQLVEECSTIINGITFTGKITVD